MRCYYCLRKVTECIEKTGDGQLICPHCGIDSVMEFSSNDELIEKHVESFHRGVTYHEDGSTTEGEIPCSRCDRVHAYKNNKYEFISAVKMKCPVTGTWLDAVLYEGENGQYYTRERLDFDAKFKRAIR